MNLFLFVFIILICCLLSKQQSIHDKLKVAIDKALTEDTFFGRWFYGDGIILDSLFEVHDSFPDLNYQTKIDQVLDSWLSQKHSIAWNFTHNVPQRLIPPVGDAVGLYPINYLSRYQHSSKPNKTDLILAQDVTYKYIVPYPYTLPDGTFSATGCWKNESARGASCVWADDSFLGLALPARVAGFGKDSELMDRAAKMVISFSKYLLDTKDGVFFHGYNHANGDHSCCKWSRANGWTLMAQTEVLLALRAFPDSNYTKEVVEDYQVHCKGLASFQNEDGRFHEIINDDTTFLETSGTAMFLWSFVEGVMNGWLKKEEFDGVIKKAGDGLMKTIDDSTGMVSGICTGSIIGPDREYYEDRPTDYLGSSPGLGSVFRALAALERYNDWSRRN